MATPRLRLGQLLVDAKLISARALDEVLLQQRTDGRRIGALLVERGFINETQLTQILSHQLSVPWVSLLHIEFSRQLLNLVPFDVADRFCLLPIYVRHVRGQGETLYVAMDDPSNEEALAACGEHSGLPVRAMIAPPQDIRNAIRVYYGVARPRSSVVELPSPSPVDPAPSPAPNEAAPSPAATEPAIAGPIEPAPAPASSAAEPVSAARAVAVAEVAPVEEPLVAEVRGEAVVVPDLPVEPPPASAPHAEESSLGEKRGRRPSMPAGAAEAAFAAVSPLADEPVPLVTRSVRPSGLARSAEGSDPDAAAASRRSSRPPESSAPPASTRSPAERLRALLSPQPAAAPTRGEDHVAHIPEPRGRAPRMVALTLLDGTTITLPAKRNRPALPASEESGELAPAEAQPVRSEPPGPDELHGLTARDLVTALRAVSHGADASEVLPSNVRWEAMFAALLSLMLKKHLIADWEFVEELKRF